MKVRLLAPGSRAKGATSIFLSSAFALSTAFAMLGGAQASESDPFISALQLWRNAPETSAEEPVGEPPVEPASEIAAEPAAEDTPIWEPARELSYPALPERPAYTVYLPEGPVVPRPAVIALHGMGGSGPAIAPLLLDQARASGWVLVAPTIPYGDWRDPNQLTGEELKLMPRLSNLIDYVRDEAGVPIAGRVMLFGFSRGAQAALRFSMLYPERVEAVAAFSAGTYTLPLRSVATTAGQTQAKMPFGVADLEQLSGRGIDQLRMTGVRYLIGVGATDNSDGDVPRQWDTFVGKNRVERAKRFASVLSNLGCETRLEVVPATGHEMNGAMLAQVTGFLESSVARAHPDAVFGVFHSADPSATSAGNHVK